MLNPLEQYLNQLRGSLRGMPAEEREAEVREVQQHLELLIAQRMEDGASPAEATRVAIEQFGAPTSHARDLKWAWRRGHKYPVVQVLLTGGVASVFSLTLFDMLLVSMKWYSRTWMNAGGASWSIGLLYFSLGVMIGGFSWLKRMSAFKSTVLGALFTSVVLGGLVAIVRIQSGVVDFPVPAPYNSPSNFWSVTLGLLAVAGACTGLSAAIAPRWFSSVSWRWQKA